MGILVLIAFMLGSVVFVSGFLFCKNVLAEPQEERKERKPEETETPQMSERERVQWENILTYNGSGEGQTEVLEGD